MHSSKLTTGPQGERRVFEALRDLNPNLASGLARTFAHDYQQDQLWEFVVSRADLLSRVSQDAAAQILELSKTHRISRFDVATPEQCQDLLARMSREPNIQQMVDAPEQIAILERAGCFDQLPPAVAQLSADFGRCLIGHSEPYSRADQLSLLRVLYANALFAVEAAGVIMTPLGQGTDAALTWFDSPYDRVMNGLPTLRDRANCFFSADSNLGQTVSIVHDSTNAVVVCSGLDKYQYASEQTQPLLLDRLIIAAWTVVEINCLREKTGLRASFEVQGDCGAEESPSRFTLTRRFSLIDATE